jgi:hypothetical protein
LISALSDGATESTSIAATSLSSAPEGAGWTEELPGKSTGAIFLVYRLATLIAESTTADLGSIPTLKKRELIAFGVKSTHA